MRHEVWSLVQDWALDIFVKRSLIPNFYCSARRFGLLATMGHGSSLRSATSDKST